MKIVVDVAVLLLMLGSLLLVPLGIPGLWIVVALTMGLAVWGQVSWLLVVSGLLAAAAAEIAELWVLRSFGRRFGGSKRAFWGAVLGGMAGIFVGFPVPVVGPLITAFLGSFVGAALVTWLETRSLRRSGRVGWGVLLARVTSVALKVGVGVALVAATAAALLF